MGAVGRSGGADALPRRKGVPHGERRAGDAARTLVVAR